MISIVIADDHGIVCEGERRLLDAEPEFEVRSEAADGREALEQVALSRPDVVILDITMSRLGGLETLERLRAQHPETKVVLLSGHSEPPFIQSAVALGAAGYVLKNGPAAEIVDQLRSPRGNPDDPYSLLSVREREVLHLIADGYSTKEVAVELSISTKTVDAHRTSLMRKIGVCKATELVRYAHRNGLIEL